MKKSVILSLAFIGTYGCMYAAYYAPQQMQVQWVRIPALHNDAIAYVVSGGRIVYVHPDLPTQPLPKGLFYLQKASAKPVKTPQAERKPVFMIQGDRIFGNPWVWSISQKSYMDWASQPPRKYDQSKVKYEDPNQLFAQWRADMNGASCNQGQQMQLQRDQKQAAAHAMPAGMLNRSTLFEDALGISEKEFQKRAGSVGKKPVAQDAVREIQAQIKAYPRAHAILDAQQKWFQPTLGQLRSIVAKKLQPPYPMGGTIDLIVHQAQKAAQGQTPPLDPNTDIRYLHEKFPNGFFMRASNFNALEGFMGDYAKDLDEMSLRPVQGEEAAMATMPASIYLRYALPKINLLENLNNLFKIDTVKHNTPLIMDLNKQQISSDDMAGFTIGVHLNTIATSGYNPDGKTVMRPDGRRPVPAYNKRLPDVGNGVVRVNNLITAAHNISKDPQNPKHRAIARAILYAAYEATILAAIAHNAKDVVLTMLGAGAFKNEVPWIYDALQDLVPLIVASGIHVHIVIRHDDDSKKQDEMYKLMAQLVDQANQLSSDDHPEYILQDKINSFFQHSRRWA